MKQDPSIGIMTPPLKGTPVSKHLNSLSIPILAIFGVLLVMIVYIWFISLGLWTQWPGITGDYVQLAAAFQHGSLSLDVKPSPAILGLRNPYDPGERRNLRYPKDLSLYKGKYYLYFGPVPALFMLIARPISSGPIGDQYLVFVFAAGILIFQSLLIMNLWKRYFRNISFWVILLCILFCGLTSPIPWMLTDARVYEAASTCGQFFFLAGLYFGITALDRPSISTSRLVISGAAWALAIGSRLTLIAPIGFVVLMAAFWMIRAYSRTKSYSRLVLSFLGLCLPLGLGLGMLGWYNWARFNSIFETGFSYQLAGPFIQKYSRVLFSPVYLLPNLYDYLVMRPTLSTVFPFLQAASGQGAGKFSTINLPPIYHEGTITGILLNTPFVLFAGLPILSLLSGTRRTTGQAGSDEKAPFRKWLIVSLTGSFLFGFIPIAAFFFVEIRYLFDSMPSLLLLSIMGFWQGHEFLSHRPALGRIYTAAGIVLLAVSILVGILCAISANAAQFQQFNPVLWNQLTRFPSP